MRDGGVDWERNGKPTLDHLSKASYNPSRENFSKKENRANVSILFSIQIFPTLHLPGMEDHPSVTLGTPLRAQKQPKLLLI